MSFNPNSPGDMFAAGMIAGGFIQALFKHYLDKWLKK